MTLYVKGKGYRYRANGQTAYRAARFEKPKRDPAITEIATKIVNLTAKQVADRSWVAPSTAYRFFSGKTNRPQHLTLVGLLHAAGYHYSIERTGK